ncbi:hypothetical protein T492DRAFT_972517 [Pavlovales sp. CCMP2436]|nr:hypothetical protein T492DRAFT_972517 [Pavlovales sp. CCMP2436]
MVARRMAAKAEPDEVPDELLVGKPALRRAVPRRRADATPEEDAEPPSEEPKRKAARPRRASPPAEVDDDGDGDEDAPPEEVTARNAPESEWEPRRKAQSAQQQERAARERQQEVIRSGLVDAGGLPAELLEQVADVNMKAKPADKSTEELRELRMAAARRQRATERQRQSAKLEAARAAERARVLADPSRLLKIEGHIRLAKIVDDPLSAAGPARAAPNFKAVQFLNSHVYGSRLKRTSSDQAMQEALAAKRRRELLSARKPNGPGVSKRGRSRKHARAKRV